MKSRVIFYDMTANGISKQGSFPMSLQTAN